MLILLVGIKKSHRQVKMTIISVTHKNKYYNSINQQHLYGKDVRAVLVSYLGDFSVQYERFHHP